MYPCVVGPGGVEGWMRVAGAGNYGSQRPGVGHLGKFLGGPGYDLEG